MNITTQRRCLNALTTAMIAGACGGGYWAVSEINTDTSMSSARRVVQTKPFLPVENDQQMTDKSIAMRSLRGPLYDPPPMASRPPTSAPRPQPPPQPRTPPVARLNLRLVGTIIDADRSVAIVSDSSGKLDVKSRGETLELSPAGITIDAITSQAVTLTYQGRQSTIQLDRNASATGGMAFPGAEPSNPYGSSRANRKRNP